MSQPGVSSDGESVEVLWKMSSYRQGPPAALWQSKGHFLC